MRGINNRITHSLRALLTRHGRTTCRVSLHCRLNVFCLFCAAKVRIFREETKKSPKTLWERRSSGREIMGLMKDYAAGGVTGVSGVTSLPVSLFQLLTSVSKSIASPPTGKANL